MLKSTIEQLKPFVLPTRLDLTSPLNTYKYEELLNEADRAITELNKIKNKVVSVDLRIKTLESFKDKYTKYKGDDSHTPLYLVYNDLVATRVISSNAYYMLGIIPDYCTASYYQLNGYRAVHVYYTEPNCFPIEIQMHTLHDHIINILLRKHIYKTDDEYYGEMLRNMYEDGIITDETSFLMKLKELKEQHALP